MQIIIGNLNAKVGQEQDSEIVGKYVLESHNELREKLGWLVHSKLVNYINQLVCRTSKTLTDMEKPKRRYRETGRLPNNQ